MSIGLSQDVEISGMNISCEWFYMIMPAWELSKILHILLMRLLGLGIGLNMLSCAYYCTFYDISGQPISHTLAIDVGARSF